MAQSYAFRIRLDQVAPVHDMAWHNAGAALRQEFMVTVKNIALDVKDRELAAGLDRHGNPLAPISWYTRVHRRSAMGPASPSAPPLTPAYGLSRTRSLLDARVHQDHILFFWRADPHTGGHWGRILGYHRQGGGRLPVRDVIGLSRQSLAEVRTRAHAWWAARRYRPIAAPAVTREILPSPRPPFLVRQVPRYKPQVPEAAIPERPRRISQIEINRNVYTLQGSSAESVRQMIANMTFSGFRKLK